MTKAVQLASTPTTKRRLDGLLIPGGESRVCAQGTFRHTDIATAVHGQHVHVI